MREPGAFRPHIGVGLGVLMLVAAPLAACAPAPRPGSLAPTLVLQDREGGQVAIQNGIPVPTFDPQPRSRIDLGGAWRVERRPFDADLSLTDRSRSLPAILAEAAGREQAGFDDRDWEQIQVPGVLNGPPDGRETGAWYRRSFYVPNAWLGLAATLKLGAVNYLADVWVNGRYLGYHEGGSTPFAFDVASHLQPGIRNSITVRVDNPAWGLRNDIVPWGLADWWNYGGITQPAWIEATPPLHVVRADVVPHLDGVDVAVTLRRAEAVVAPRERASPAPSATAEP
ncbi:MAG: sugar-binding domain-containing protein, partial [Candidatus Limnocylindria bacterium]